MKNTFVAGSRVYNFEIRQSTTGVRYLVIDEIQAEDSHRFMVFEEYWDGFLAWLIHIIGEAGLNLKSTYPSKADCPRKSGEY